MARRGATCRAAIRGVLVAIVTLVASGCGASTSGETAPADESIFRAVIPGTTGGTTSTAAGGTVTKLFDVTGDWSLVSIELARIVQDEGWTIVALNCVGTGNDVIARKRVGGEWLLLESGAGARGAGLIVSRDPAPQAPGPLSVTGSCPRALIDSVG